jgi:hypothetical protein
METLSFLKKLTFDDPHEQSLINKKVALPPKELISKEYTSDIKPLIKLMYAFLLSVLFSTK